MTEKTKPKRTFASVTANYFARERALLEQEGIAKAANEQEAEQRARYLKEQERRQEEEDNRSGLNKQFDTMRREAEASFSRRPVKVRTKDGVTIVPESDESYDKYLDWLTDNISEVEGSFYLSKKALRGGIADVVTVGGATVGAVDPTYTAMEGVRDAGKRADAVLLDNDFVNKLYATRYARWQEKKSVDLGASKRVADIEKELATGGYIPSSPGGTESLADMTQGSENKALLQSELAKLKSQGHTSTSWLQFAKENPWGFAGDLTQEVTQELGSAVLSKGAFAPIRSGARTVVGNVARAALKDAPKLRAAVTDARIVAQTVSDALPAKVKGAAEVTAQTTLASAVETYDAHANTYLDTKDQLTAKYIEEGLDPSQAAIRAAMEANQIAIGDTLANIGSEALFGGKGVERLLRGQGGRASPLKTAFAEMGSETLAGATSKVNENRVLGNDLTQDLSDTVQQSAVMGFGAGGSIASGVKAAEMGGDYLEGRNALIANDLANGQTNKNTSTVFVDGKGRKTTSNQPGWAPGTESWTSSGTAADVVAPETPAPAEEVPNSTTSTIVEEPTLSGLARTGKLGQSDVDVIRSEALKHLKKEKERLVTASTSPDIIRRVNSVFENKARQVAAVAKKLSDGEALSKEEEAILDQFTDSSENTDILRIKKRLSTPNTVTVENGDTEDDWLKDRMATGSGSEDLKPVVRLSKKTASIRQTYVLGKLLRQMSSEDRDLVNKAFAKGTLEIYDNLSTDNRARVSDGKVSVNIKNFTGRNEFLKAFTKLEDEKDIANKLSTFEATVRHEARHLVFDRTGKVRKDVGKAGPEEAHAAAYVQRAIDRGETDTAILEDLAASEKEAFSEEIVEIVSKNKKARNFLVKKTAEKYGMSEKAAKKMVDFRIAVYSLDKTGINNSLRQLIEDGTSGPARQALIPEKNWKYIKKSPHQVYKAIANAVAGDGDAASIKTLRKYFGDLGKKMSDDDLGELVSIVSDALPYYDLFNKIPRTPEERGKYEERLRKFRKHDPELAGFVMAAVSGKDKNDATLMAVVSNALYEPNPEVSILGDLDDEIEGSDSDNLQYLTSDDAQSLDFTDAVAQEQSQEDSSDLLEDDWLKDTAEVEVTDSQESIDKAEDSVVDSDVASEGTDIAKAYEKDTGYDKLEGNAVKDAKEKLDTLYSQYQIQMHPASGLPVIRNKIAGAFFYAMRSKLRTIRAPGVAPTYKEELSVSDVMAAKGDTDFSGMRKAITDLASATINAVRDHGSSDIAFVIKTVSSYKKSISTADARRRQALLSWDSMPEDAPLVDRARVIEELLITSRTRLLAGEYDVDINKILDRLSSAASVLRVFADPDVTDTDALAQGKLVAAVPATEAQELRESLASIALSAASDAETLKATQDAEVVALASQSIDNTVGALKEIATEGTDTSYAKVVRKYKLTLPKVFYVKNPKDPSKPKQRATLVTNIAPPGATSKATHVYLPIKKGTSLYNSVLELAKAKRAEAASYTYDPDREIELTGNKGVEIFFSDLGRDTNGGFKSSVFLPVSIQSIVDTVTERYPSIQISEKNIGALVELVYGVRPVAPYGKVADVKYKNKNGNEVRTTVSISSFAVKLNKGNMISAEEYKAVRGDDFSESTTSADRFGIKDKLESASESAYFASTSLGLPANYPGGQLAMSREALESLIASRNRLYAAMSKDSLTDADFDDIASKIAEKTSLIKFYTDRVKALAAMPEREAAALMMEHEDDARAFVLESLSSGEYDKDLQIMFSRGDKEHKLMLEPPSTMAAKDSPVFTDGLYTNELEDLIGSEAVSRLLNRAGIGATDVTAGRTDATNNDPIVNPPWTFKPQKRSRFTVLTPWRPSAAQAEATKARKALSDFLSKSPDTTAFTDEQWWAYSIKKGDLERAISSADAAYRKEQEVYSYGALVDTVRMSDLSLLSQQDTFNQYAVSEYLDVLATFKKVYTDVGFPQEATEAALDEAMPLVPIVSVFLPPSQNTDTTDESWMRERIRKVLSKGAIIAIPRGTSSAYFAGPHQYSSVLGVNSKDLEIVRDGGVDYVRRLNASSLFTLEDVIRLKKSLVKKDARKTYTSYKEDLSELATTAASNENLKDRIKYSSKYVAKKYHSHKVYREESKKGALEVLEFLYPQNSSPGVYVNGELISTIKPGKDRNNDNKLLYLDKVTVRDEKAGLDVLDKLHSALNATRADIAGNIKNHTVFKDLQAKLPHPATVKRLSKLTSAQERVDSAIAMLEVAKERAAMAVSESLLASSVSPETGRASFTTGFNKVLPVHELLLQRNIPFAREEAAVRQEGYSIIEEASMDTAPLVSYKYTDLTVTGKRSIRNKKLGAMIVRPAIDISNVWTAGLTSYGKWEIPAISGDYYAYMFNFSDGQSSWQDPNKTSLARLEKRQAKDPQANFDRNGELKATLKDAEVAKVLHAKAVIRQKILAEDEAARIKRRKELGASIPKAIGREARRKDITREAVVIRQMSDKLVSNGSTFIKAMEARAATERAKRFAESLRNSEMMDINTLSAQVADAVNRVPERRREALQDAISTAMTLDVTSDMYAEIMDITREYVSTEYGPNGRAAIDAALRLRDKYINTKKDIINLVSQIPGADTNALARKTLDMLEKTMHSYMTTSYSIHNVHAGESWRTMITESINSLLKDGNSLYSTKEGVSLAKAAAQALIDAHRNNQQLLGYSPDGEPTMRTALLHLRDQFLSDTSIAKFDKSSSKTVFSEGTANLRNEKTLVGPEMAPFRALLGEVKSLAVRLNTTAQVVTHLRSQAEFLNLLYKEGVAVQVNSDAYDSMMVALNARGIGRNVFGDAFANLAVPRSIQSVVQEEIVVTSEVKKKLHQFGALDKAITVLTSPAIWGASVTGNATHVPLIAAMKSVAPEGSGSYTVRTTMLMKYLLEQSLPGSGNSTFTTPPEGHPVRSDYLNMIAGGYVDSAFRMEDLQLALREIQKQDPEVVKALSEGFLDSSKAASIMRALMKTKSLSSQGLEKLGTVFSLLELPAKIALHMGHMDALRTSTKYKNARQDRLAAAAGELVLNDIPSAANIPKWIRGMEMNFITRFLGFFWVTARSMFVGKLRNLALMKEAGVDKKVYAAYAAGSGVQLWMGSVALSAMLGGALQRFLDALMDPPEYPPTEEQQKALRDAYIRYYEDRDYMSKYIHIGWDSNGNPALMDISFFSSLYQQQVRLAVNIFKGLNGESRDLFVDSLVRDLPLGLVGDSLVSAIAPSLNSMVDDVDDTYVGAKASKTFSEYLASSGGTAGLVGAYKTNDLLRSMGIRPTYANASVILDDSLGRMYAITKNAQANMISAWKQDPTKVWTPDMVRELTATRFRGLVDADRRTYALAVDYAQALGFSSPEDEKFLDLIAPSKDDNLLRKYITGEHGEQAIALKLYDKKVFAEFSNSEAATSEITKMKTNMPNANKNLMMNGLLSIMEAVDIAGTQGVPVEVKFDAFRVKDGDTFYAVIDGTTREVRPIGMDAAEKTQAESSAITSKLTQTLASGVRSGIVIKDEKTGKYAEDQDGRLLMDVRVNAVPLPELMQGDVYTFIPGAKQPDYQHPRFIKAKSREK